MRSAWWALRSLLLWSASMALVALWLPVVAAVWVLERDGLKRRAGRMFRRLGVALSWLHRARVDVRADLPDAGGVYVVVSNHQSLADVPALCHLPWEMKWLAKAELFRLPIVGWMMHLAADIPVDRDDRRKAASALRRASRTLENGCSVMVFPEGTRSRDGEVGPFTDGAFHLALRTGVPVLPVAIDGSGRWMPRGAWRFGPPPRIRVRVFPPIEAHQHRDAAVLREEARRVIAGQVSDWRSRATEGGRA